MCGPVAIGAAMLASTAVSAYGQYQQSRYQSDIAKYNADVADNSAKDAINQGNAQASQQRQRARQLAGTQAATMAANGVDLGGGTATDIFADTAGMGELDALTTVNNAQRQAYGLEAQAASQRSQATADISFGNMQVGSTLLNGTLGAYQGYKMAGGGLTAGSKVGSGKSDMFGSLQSSSYGSNKYTF